MEKAAAKLGELQAGTNVLEEVARKIGDSKPPPGSKGGSKSE